MIYKIKSRRKYYNIWTCAVYFSVYIKYIFTRGFDFISFHIYIFTDIKYVGQKTVRISE